MCSSGVAGISEVAREHLRSRRRQRHARFEDKRMLDVAIESKSMCLEIGAIWAGREQVDSDVMCAVELWERQD